MRLRSPTFAVRFRGPRACFTRPELKVERVTYEVMTPSAARGALEAILWKPAIRWEIERIHVLAPIRFGQVKRNEVNSKLSTRGDHGAFFADDDRVRAQRNTLYLRDVDYVVEAFFSFTERVGPDDTLEKFVSMFRRRLEKGQCFSQPYFGCREFAASFELAAKPFGTEPSLTGSRPLGVMLYDMHHNATYPHVCKKCAPRFFEARLVDGVLAVPPYDEVMS
jgi:CRISPR-associated protein Cas5d